MLRLDKVIKPWKESAALNDHINLYGFWNETAFLTKSGDLGMVLSVPGVDYESLDRSEQEYAVKRLEAALKAFGPGFHVYQYLFKSNRPDIPFATYDDPIVEAAIDQRRKFFEAKRDHLYQVEIFYCILLEGARSKTGVVTALARLLRDPEGAIAELKAQFTNDNIKTLLRTHIERDLQRLDQHVQAFARQLADFMQIEVLKRQGQFMFFRRLLNYDDWRVAGRPQSTQFLDYQVVNSDIEAERDHLRVAVVSPRAQWIYTARVCRRGLSVRPLSDPPLFPDLLGFRAVLREHAIDWTLFFDAPGAPPAQRSKKMDGKLVRALIQLPVAVTGECEIEDYHSLAVRDLQRGQGVGLPSGEAVARHIGVTPLTAEQVGITSTGWNGETPLWYYILREADACTGGHRLGPVGGRIVAEVLVGLIDMDPTSFRRNNQEWRPKKTLSELLTS